MAKPPVIEDKQIEHLIKATASYSRVPLRDTALLLTLYGTALAVTELATISVGDYLLPNGAVRVTSAVRPDVAHNGAERALYWSNKRVAAAIDEYLAWRFSQRQGRTTTPLGPTSRVCTPMPASRVAAPNQQGARSRSSCIARVTTWCTLRPSLATRA